MSNIHLIGNAHLDPVWLWRWQDGFAEILATFRSALDRMNEFPDFKFTSACSAYYEWVEKTNPEMFEEIRERVKEGRWNIVGGMLIQPDCNIPCGESFSRSLLIGQRYFKEKFGITVKTGYNVDSFGHNAALPKILNNAGIENYVFMRPGSHEKDLAPSLFNWKSDDESSVCTFRIHNRYCIDSTCLDIFGEIKQMSDKDGYPHMAFYGVGNHGGGPTIRLLDEIHNLEIDDLVFSTPDEYFDSVKNAELPAVTDELQHHARGCYSAETSVKSKNRRCEQNLIAAEKLCVMASKLTDYKYPQKKLNKAWKNLLFNNFHDIMCGCAIKSAYTDADYLFGEIMSITEQEINKALTAIALNIDTLGESELPSYKLRECWAIWEHEKLGTPIVVFNPHPFEVTETIEVFVTSKKVTDSNGKEIPFQIVRGEMTNIGELHMTAFNATIPPYGYEVYRLFRKQESELDVGNILTISERLIENDKIKVEFSAQTGDICSFYDKEKGEYIISKPCKAILLDETCCDTWAHDKTSLGEVCDTFNNPTFTILENGNVRATLRVVTTSGNSIIQRDYTMTPGSNEITVKAKVRIAEKHRTLKFTFPTDGDKIVSQIQYGTFERPQDTGEESFGMWFASGKLGVANDSKHGYDTKDNEIRLSVLRTAVYADHFGENLRDEFSQYMDMDTHEFSYRIFPYTGKSNAERSAAVLNFGLRSITSSFHKGTLPEKASYIHVKNDNIIISAIKNAEDNSGTVIRLFDIEGKNTNAEIKFFDKDISPDVNHNQIKTILVGKEKIRELNICEL